VDKSTGFDLLHPTAPPSPPLPKQKLKDFFHKLKEDHKLMLAELKMVCARRKRDLVHLHKKVRPPDIVATIHQQIENLATMEILKQLGKDVVTEFKDVFEPIPHIDDLPMDVYCRIKLKDPFKTVQTHSYSTPRKYKEAWYTLIQQHLDTG
jgi:urease gamma subunit